MNSIFKNTYNNNNNNNDTISYYLLKQKPFSELTIVFGWTDQNFGSIKIFATYNQPNFINQKYCAVSQKFFCPYKIHILWLNQPKFG